MNEIENHLINLYNIFNNKYLDKRVEYSLAAIKTEIINRDLHRVNVNDVTSPEQKIRDAFFDQHLQLSEHDDGPESTKSIVDNSPFRTHFNSLFEQVQKEIEKHNSIAEKTISLNPYYFPQLFEILSKQLYLVPLWSGIMIYTCQQNYPFCFDRILSRLSNNPVEGWFGHLKNHPLENNIVMTSELVTILYERIVSKFIEFYMKDINKDLINIYDDAGNTDYDKKVQGIIHLDDQEADKSIDLVNKENNLRCKFILIKDSR